jgi:hypothetical protein
MSAGGQNTLSRSGIQGMRLRDASDFTAQSRVRQIYQLFNSNAPTAVRPRIPNGNDVYLEFLSGVKEVSSTVGGSVSCPACVGLTYNGNGLVLKYRNGNFPPV